MFLIHIWSNHEPYQEAVVPRQVKIQGFLW